MVSNAFEKSIKIPLVMARIKLFIYLTIKKCYGVNRLLRFEPQRFA